MRFPLPSHIEIPDIVQGYELDVLGGWFHVILPEASVNLALNPSLEVNTTGWSAMAGTISRVATYQRFGTYSLKCLPTAAVNDGIYYGATASTLIPTTAGQWYTASFYIKGAGGYAYKVYWADFAGNQIGQAKTFFMGADWMRIINVSWFETQSTSRRLYITKNNQAQIFPFYVDGLLVENKAYSTTYFDGDSVGYVVGQTDFYWNGPRHASISTRTAQTLAGGKRVKLQDLGFKLSAIVGLGMPDVNLIGQDYGWQDGALFQRVRKPSRDFTLVGYVGGSTFPEFKRNRAALEAAFSPDNVSTQQSLTLQYEATDDCGVSLGEVLNIPCLYRDGLPGNINNLYAEKVALGFTMFQPLIAREGDEGASLGYQATIANSNYILQRSAAGVWDRVGTGANNAVWQVVIGPDGCLYAAGAFSSMGGVANTSRIAKWDGTRWTALGSGADNNTVISMVFGPDGTLYIAGSFLSVSGVANTAYIAKWDGTNWSALGTGANGIVYSLAMGTDGTLYAGGDFTLMGGVANTIRIAKWNGAVWTPLSTGADAEVFALKVASDNTLYAGGDFLNIGGVAINRIAKWNGAAWSGLGTGAAAAQINAIEIGADGTLYIGGFFTSAGGVTGTAYLAKWNGVAWSALGGGVNDFVYCIRAIGDSIYIGGDFTTADGNPMANLVIWNGSAFVGADIILSPVSPTLRSITLSPAGILYLGYNKGGSCTVSGTSVVTNSGTIPSKVTITITGPGTVYLIKNYSTRETIQFNLALLAGEIATLILSPAGVTFTSNFRGNILGAILPGSNDAQFQLLPGTNNISVFMAGSTTAATAVDMRWVPQYLALEH